MKKTTNYIAPPAGHCLALYRYLRSCKDLAAEGEIKVSPCIRLNGFFIKLVCPDKQVQQVILKPLLQAFVTR